MTEEEKNEFDETYDIILDGYESKEEPAIVDARATARDFDFYNAHHFDYRGLIDMGLALEAPEGMYKTE